MFIKLILLILAIWIILTLYEIYKSRNIKKLHINASPDNTVIAFDLHEVVLKKNTYKIIKLIIFKLPKIELLYLALSPQVWWSLIKYLIGSTPLESIIETISKYTSKGNHIRQSFINLINSQNKNIQVIEIIKKLKSMGYTIYLASNIGPNTLKQLSNKMPELKYLFDDIVNPNIKNQFSRKPSPKFYEILISKSKRNNTHIKNIILIDNHKPNILASYKHNIFGIIFKSPQDLITQLKKINIKIT